MIKKLIRAARERWAERSGAVTVDFVVLTAGVIIMFLLVVQPIYSGSRSMVFEINEKLAEHASTVWDF